MKLDSDTVTTLLSYFSGVLRLRMLHHGYDDGSGPYANLTSDELSTKLEDIASELKPEAYSNARFIVEQLMAYDDMLTKQVNDLFQEPVVAGETHPLEKMNPYIVMGSLVPLLKDANHPNLQTAIAYVGRKHLLWVLSDPVIWDSLVAHSTHDSLVIRGAVVSAFELNTGVSVRNVLSDMYKREPVLRLKEYIGKLI